MARRHNTTPEQVSTGRLKWLKAQAKELANYRAGAQAAGSWSAVAALAREQRACRDQIDEEEIRLAAPAAAAADPSSMTPAEWLARVTEDARACSDADLEVYLREYATRHKLRALVVDGVPTFQRKSTG